MVTSQMSAIPQKIAVAVIWILLASAVVVSVAALAKAAVELYNVFTIIQNEGVKAGLKTIDAGALSAAAGGVAALAGLSLAAVAGYYRFRLFREDRPHLSLALQLSTRMVSPDSRHIGAVATLHNSSKVVVEVRSVTWGLSAVAPYPEQEIQNKLAELFNPESSEWMKFGWNQVYSADGV